MNILEINHTDLPGRLFNGYDLHKSLNKLGYVANQMVLEKFGNDETVFGMLKNIAAHTEMREWEREHSVSNVIMPYGHKILQSDEYKQADIVHCHILHNHFVSLFDYEKLLGDKRSVWTIHDSWIFTGDCLHPLDCEKWKSGCFDCSRIEESNFPMDIDNTRFMWNLKREVLSKINPYVVVTTEYMKSFLEQSPFTKHFDKIRIIPFGIEFEQYRMTSKIMAKRKYGFSDDDIVIGFRADDVEIKGCKYLYKALEKISEKVVLLSVGVGAIPKSLKAKFTVKELGWLNNKEDMLNFWGAVDVFAMPSLAEGFGLMAVEAMAAGCVVVCFEGVTVAEITEAPKCGVSAKYQSIEDMTAKLDGLIKNKDEIAFRASLGKRIVCEKYSYDNYLKQHIDLYNEVYEKLNKS